MVDVSDDAKVSDFIWLHILEAEHLFQIKLLLINVGSKLFFCNKPFEPGLVLCFEQIKSQTE